MVGFNISTKEDFDFASSYTAGGNYRKCFYQNILQAAKNLKQDTRTFYSNQSEIKK